MKKYRTILADPPWDMGTMGTGKDTRLNRSYKVGLKTKTPYPVMNIKDIIELPVEQFAEIGCHLWLWTTNRFLHEAFHVMSAWGFKYHNTITWTKPSGSGAWFVVRTQHLLFGYKDKCIFNKERYKPTIYNYIPTSHSTKPEKSYELIEDISDSPRLELFARRYTELFEKREGWDVWGNEVESDIKLF